MPFVKSYKYDLWGESEVEEVTGKFYKFTQKRGGDDKVVYVPESDINDAVEGFSIGGGRRNRRATKKARVNKRRYTRRK